MNNLNNIVIANVLNRSLYQLTEATLALGRTTYTAEKQYLLMVEELQAIYSQDSFLSNIKPRPLFHSYETLTVNNPSMRKSWQKLTQDTEQHLAKIEQELSKHKYRYDSNEKINRLVEDSENAYLDMLAEMSEPTSENDIAYIMRYTLAGVLTLNNFVIARPRLDSPADIALQEAFKTPNTSVSAKGNLSKFKHDIPLPIELKNLLFRVSAGRFKVIPYISQANLDEHHISRGEIDLILEKLKRLQ